jgi:hypothetical protein
MADQVDSLGLLAHYERLGCNIGMPIGGGVAGLDPVIATARTEADAEKIVRALNTLGAVEGTPEERIAVVLHSIGFGAERHELARRMLKLAQDFDPAGGQ